MDDLERAQAERVAAMASLRGGRGEQFDTDLYGGDNNDGFAAEVVDEPDDAGDGGVGGLDPGRGGGVGGGSALELAARVVAAQRRDAAAGGGAADEDPMAARCVACARHARAIALLPLPLFCPRARPSPPLPCRRAAGGSGLANTRITDREDAYHARQIGRASCRDRV
jgi:hypothetical protein